LYFKAIVQWTKYDPERETHFEELFDMVRLERLKPEYLSKSVAKEVCI